MSFVRNPSLCLPLLALFAAASSQAQPHKPLHKHQNYIVGGTEVGPRDPIAASTVALYDPSPDGQSGSLCSASLIGNDVALTAAHCIQPHSGDPVVLFGPNLHAPGMAPRPVEGVAVNPKWQSHAGKGMDQGDIALVKFGGGLPTGYHSISTAQNDSDIQRGENAVLAGYGISNSQTHVGAGRLRKTTVQVLQNRPGKTEMVLDQTHGRGACHGDSGGPAFVRSGGKTVLAGVTNRGYPDQAPDDCAHDVVYTKVPAYRSWIQKTEAKLDSTHATEPASAIGIPGMMSHRIRKTASKTARNPLPKGLAKQNRAPKAKPRKPGALARFTRSKRSRT